MKISVHLPYEGLNKPLESGQNYATGRNMDWIELLYCEIISDVRDSNINRGGTKP